MSKQINLSLATAGDVAVLRNGERKEIVSIDGANSPMLTVIIHFKYDHLPYHYIKDGLGHSVESNIIDVLRNGDSILNNQNNKP